jgi:ribosomal protein S18 acetylase RimI-like enzyme
MRLLDNITWNALTGPHAHFSLGTDEARRYEKGFPAFAAFPDPSRPNFAAIEPYSEPGEHFYCDGWSGPAPTGWKIDFDGTMYKMVWTGAMPAADGAVEKSNDAVPLTREHAAKAVELAKITKPGPFGPRNLDLGEYFGIFDGERLIAMAGERLAAGALREVSAVCTHPDHQGRGLARRLMTKIIRRQMQRGETPFLHVMRSNEGARGLYERMGFEIYRESVVRVVSRE